MKSYRNITVILLAGFTVFHLWYIAAAFMDLAPDEAYYWEWSRRLDWSYYSKGPMAAWLIAVSTRLGAHTEFFVRFPAVLLGAGTATLVYLLAGEIFRTERAGFLAVVICGAMPLFVAGSMLMTIDAPFVFFWTLALYSLYRAQEAREKRMGWWILLGLALGMGFLSKYTMLLFFLCFGVYGFVAPATHHSLKTSGPYVAVSVCFVLALPVLVWNWLHDWVSLGHVLKRTGVIGDGGRFSAATVGDFLGAQIAVVSPSLFLCLLAAMFRAGRLGLREKDRPQLFLFAFSMPLLAFFLLWSIYARVEANWAVCAYIAGTVALAGWWDQLANKAPKGAGRLKLAVGLVLIVLPGIAMSSVAHFPQTLDLLGIHLPVKLDPTARLRGWKELGAAVGKISASYGRKLAVVSDNYQIASETAFYAPGHPRAYSVNLGRSLNQYDIWGGLEEIKDRDVIFVTKEEESARSMAATCEEIRKLEVVETFHRGQRGQVFFLFLCRGYRGPLP